jgi:hypothetical protein
VHAFSERFKIKIFFNALRDAMRENKGNGINDGK